MTIFLELDPALKQTEDIQKDIACSSSKMCVLKWVSVEGLPTFKAF